MAGPFVLVSFIVGTLATQARALRTVYIAGIDPDLYNCTTRLGLGAGVVKV